jgi:hypothetical protein
MLNFTKNAFRVGVEIMLWLNLVLCVVIGYVGGTFSANQLEEIGVDNIPAIVPVVVQILIMLIFGLLSNILIGGLIATLVDMGKRIEKVESTSNEIKSAVLNIEKLVRSGKQSPQANTANTPPTMPG